MIKAWRTRRAAAKVARLENDAEYWRQEATRLSIAAYHLDMMAEPLKWGRLQSAANWARHSERKARAAIAKATS